MASVTPERGAPFNLSTCPATAVTPGGAASGRRLCHGEGLRSVFQPSVPSGIQISSSLLVESTGSSCVVNENVPGVTVSPAEDTTPETVT